MECCSDKDNLYNSGLDSIQLFGMTADAFIIYNKEKAKANIANKSEIHLLLRLFEMSVYGVKLAD